MTTILILFGLFLIIGLTVRSYTMRTRLLIAVCVVGALALLFRGG